MPDEGLPALPTEPVCEIQPRKVKTFDESGFSITACNHVLAREKISKEWEITC